MEPEQKHHHYTYLVLFLVLFVGQIFLGYSQYFSAHRTLPSNPYIKQEPPAPKEINKPLSGTPDLKPLATVGDSSIGPSPAPVDENAPKAPDPLLPIQKSSADTKPLYNSTPPPSVEPISNKYSPTVGKIVIATIKESKTDAVVVTFEKASDSPGGKIEENFPLVLFQNYLPQFKVGDKIQIELKPNPNDPKDFWLDSVKLLSGGTPPPFTSPVANTSAPLVPK
jgi:hypothetical protein